MRTSTRILSGFGSNTKFDGGGPVAILNVGKTLFMFVRTHLSEVKREATQKAESNG